MSPSVQRKSRREADGVLPVGSWGESWVVTCSVSSIGDGSPSSYGNPVKKGVNGETTGKVPDPNPP